MQTCCTTSARRSSPGNPILPSPLSKLYCCQSSQGEAWCHLHSPRHSRLLPRLLLGFPNHGSRSVMTGRRPGRQRTAAVTFPHQPAFGTGYRHRHSQVTFEELRTFLFPFYPLAELQGPWSPGRDKSTYVCSCCCSWTGVAVGTAFVPTPSFFPPHLTPSRSEVK